MAAATTIIAGSAALASTGLGIGQAIAGATKKKDAQDAINQSVKELRTMIKQGQANRLKALQVPTMGAELRERALARGTAGQVEAMQEAGAAGVIGGAGRLTQAVGEQAEQEAARIDALQSQRDRAVLQQEQALENQRYQGLLGLEQMELQGASQAASDAMAQQQAGVLAIGTGLGQMATLGASLANPYGNQQTTTDTKTTTDTTLQKVQNRPTDDSIIQRNQPDFRKARLDSQGRNMYTNPDFNINDPNVFGENMFYQYSPNPNVLNYAALGYLGGNN
ncbi:MAG: hypothetical protein Unbinned2299contig1000_28 [Prokaryotic dsDNA virus sp.]|nr:MAG: hypothetical protein Unbinned2299contig1000_28 [Prokaryotic dsDNA virus sp.]|tara:strand:+ start:6139 stop:6975 length:837 start_codon:yes stop_codon:yes gene_type:complete